MLECCQQGAAAFGGPIDVQSLDAMEGYRFGEGDAPVVRADAAIRAAGMEPWRTTTGGVSDANELNAKGLHRCDLGRLRGHPHRPGIDADRRAEPAGGGLPGPHARNVA